MYILFVTHFFPPRHTAGTENYTRGLAQAMQARGHRTQVVCAEDWNTGDAYWNGVTHDVVDGVPVTRLHLNWLKSDNPNGVLFDSAPVEQWFDTLLAEDRPDLVHVTSAHSLGVGVLEAVARAKIPLVLTLMDFWFLCPRTNLLRDDGEVCDGRTTAWECQRCLLGNSGIFQRTRTMIPARAQQLLWQTVAENPVLARQNGARGMALDMNGRKAAMGAALTLPDTVISHSEVVRDMFAGAGLSDRIVHLRNGIDTGWMASYAGKTPSRAVRIGYVGQVVPIKGVDVLVAAFQRANLGGEAELGIWGDLGREPAYAATLQELAGDNPAITFHGGFQRGQLAEVLAQIDVLVVPSLWYENAPLVIQEAMAVQTPVIATNLGGMAEVVRHDETGLLFARGDAGDLARQLQRIVSEPGLRERLRAGIPPVRTIDDEVNELESIYRDLQRRNVGSLAVQVQVKA